MMQNTAVGGGMEGRNHCMEIHFRQLSINYKKTY